MADATYTTKVYMTSGGDQMSVVSGGNINLDGGKILDAVEYISTGSTGLSNRGASLNVTMYAAASSGSVYTLAPPDAGEYGTIKRISVVTSSANYVVIQTTVAAFKLPNGSTYGTIRWESSNANGHGYAELLASSSGVWNVLNCLSFSSGNGAPYFGATT